MMTIAHFENLYIVPQPDFTTMHPERTKMTMRSRHKEYLLGKSKFLFMVQTEYHERHATMYFHVAPNFIEAGHFQRLAKLPL